MVILRLSCDSAESFLPEKDSEKLSSESNESGSEATQSARVSRVSLNNSQSPHFHIVYSLHSKHHYHTRHEIIILLTNIPLKFLLWLHSTTALVHYVFEYHYVTWLLLNCHWVVISLSFCNHLSLVCNFVVISLSFCYHIVVVSLSFRCLFTWL